MSAKAIFEADGKAILNYHLTRAPVIKPSPLPAPTTHNPPSRLASLHFPEDAAVEDVLNQAEVTYPWLLQPGAKFVAKPDQLIKRRGKSGLLALNKTWAEARAWVAERAGKEQKVEHTVGVLRQFLVEPFVPHPQDTEYYININSVRDVSNVLFSVHLLVSCVSVSSRNEASASRVEGGHLGDWGGKCLCLCQVPRKKERTKRRSNGDLVRVGSDVVRAKEAVSLYMAGALATGLKFAAVTCRSNRPGGRTDVTTERVPGTT